jgi:hypothetical protein
LAAGLQIEGVGVEQPVLDQSIDDHVQAQRGTLHRHRERQRLFEGRCLKTLRRADHARIAYPQMALANRMHLVVVFNLVGGDFEHAARLVVGRGFVQRVQK